METFTRCSYHFSPSGLCDRLLSGEPLSVMDLSDNLTHTEKLSFPVHSTNRMTPERLWWIFISWQRDNKQQWDRLDWRLVHMSSRSSYINLSVLLKSSSVSPFGCALSHRHRLQRQSLSGMLRIPLLMIRWQQMALKWSCEWAHMGKAQHQRSSKQDAFH